MTGMCPHCGYNLEADAPITLGDWRVTPSLCMYGSQIIPLSPTEGAVLYAIAKGGGDWVSTEAIHNRVTEADSNKLAAVMVFRIRKKLGSRCPIESRRVRGHGGYRWKT